MSGFTTADFYGDDTEGAGGGDATAVTDDADLFEDVELDEPDADDTNVDEVDPAESGEVDESDEDEAPILDPSQFANHKVRVKVDGEDVEVPLTEALQGYQRQADYTRKTQELAFWKRVDEAMKVAPEQTLAYLQQQYGVGVAQQAAQQAQEDDDDWGIDDPVQQKLAQFEQQLKPLFDTVQQQAAERAVRSEVARLEAQYGELFNANEVLEHAVYKLGLDDPNMIEFAFKDLMFNKTVLQTQGQKAFAAKQQSQQAQRKAAAQKAAATVGSGASAPRGRAAAAPQREPRDAAEAIAMALAEMRANG